MKKPSKLKKRGLICKLALLIVFSAATAFIQAKNIVITERGAVPDGSFLCTEIIQKAIDDCSSSGGGSVIFPSGSYLTGTIYLKDNVTIYLESGSVLLGSTKIVDYKPSNLIRAFEAKNIGIAGNGRIDGQGFAFWIPTNTGRFEHMKQAAGNMIQLEACENVRITDVNLSGSESWTLHLLACNDVLVSGVRIRNLVHGPNTDGIDIQACSNVKIMGCDIQTNDDAIVLKNRNPRYYGKPCENITITNCVLSTICEALKIGTESLNDFRNIVFSNSVIRPPKTVKDLEKLNYNMSMAPMGGVSLETVDGANLQGVTITNIVMENVRVPIFIRLANRGAGEQKVAVPVPGSLKDVIISNIVAYGATSASSVTAIPGYYVENVLLSNILIRTAGGGDSDLAAKKLDERVEKYPQAFMWGPMPVSGFFVRHVRGIQMKDIKIIVDTADKRPLMIFDDVEDLYVNNLQTNDIHSGVSVVEMTDVRNARILDVDFPAQVKIPWFSVKGSKTSEVTIRPVFRTDYNKLLIKTSDVSAGAVRFAD
jgi:polygalacturonase